MLILFNPLPNPIHIFSKSRWSNSAKAVTRTSVSTLSIRACGVPEVKIILHTYHTCKNTLVSPRVNNNTSVLILKSQYFSLKCWHKLSSSTFCLKFYKILFNFSLSSTQMSSRWCLSVSFTSLSQSCFSFNIIHYPSLFYRSLVFIWTLSISFTLLL